MLRPCVKRGLWYPSLAIARCSALSLARLLGHASQGSAADLSLANGGKDSVSYVEEMEVRGFIRLIAVIIVSQFPLEE